MSSDATELPTDMSTWASGTKHYQLANGDCVAVMVDTEELTPLGEAYLGHFASVAGVALKNVTRIPRPTHVIACTPEGYAISLTPVKTFPPGTTHEQALTQLEE